MNVIQIELLTFSHEVGATFVINLLICIHVELRPVSTTNVKGIILCLLIDSLTLKN